MFARLFSVFAAMSGVGKPIYFAKVFNLPDKTFLDAVNVEFVVPHQRFYRFFAIGPGVYPIVRVVHPNVVGCCNDRFVGACECKSNGEKKRRKE